MEVVPAAYDTVACLCPAFARLEGTERNTWLIAMRDFICSTGPEKAVQVEPPTCAVHTHLQSTIDHMRRENKPIPTLDKHEMRELRRTNSRLANSLTAVSSGALAKYVNLWRVDLVFKC